MTPQFILTPKRMFVYTRVTMRERMKLAAAIMVGVGVGAGLIWWLAFGRPLGSGHSRVASVVGERLAQPVRAEEYVTCRCTIDPEEYVVADTQVRESYNFSCTLRVMNQDLSPMMISAATKELLVSVASMMFSMSDYTTLGGWPEGVVPAGKAPGADGFVYLCAFFDAQGEYWDFSGSPTWLWVGDDTGWTGAVDISLTSTHSHIARTQSISTHMGTEGGPTHSTELAYVDEWTPHGQMTTQIVFGDLSAVATVDNIWSHPTPGSNLALTACMHKSMSGDVTYGRFEDIRVSNIPLELDGLSRKAPGAEYYLVGDGASINIESREGRVGDLGWSGSISPPFMLDLSSIGLADWGQTAHNDRYDDVLVWLHDGTAVCPAWQSLTEVCPAPPGFWPRALGPGVNPLDCYCPFCGSRLRPHGLRKACYINAAWPDTSETDWLSTGPFEECTACPLPLGELRRIFSPYVQRFAPYAGWQRTDGAQCEFWSGHIGFLLDRTSLRANNLPVSA